MKRLTVILILLFAYAGELSSFAVADDNSNVLFASDGSSITLKSGFRFTELESGENDLGLRWNRGAIVGPKFGVNRAEEWAQTVRISVTTYPAMALLYDLKSGDDSIKENTNLTDGIIRNLAEKSKEVLSESARENGLKAPQIKEDWVEFMGRKAWCLSGEHTLKGRRQMSGSCLIFQARGSFYTLHCFTLGRAPGKWASSCIEMIADHPEELSKDPKVVASQFDLNTPKGQAEYGHALVFGRRGVIRNEEEGVTWLRKAAEADHPWAQCKLGRYYQVGQSVPKDYAEAAKWLRKAADQGDATAQGVLGDLYAQGLGVERDDKLTIAWWTRSAEQGYARTQYMLGYSFSNGIFGIAKDAKIAASWYQKAADQGNKNAEKNLGLLYRDGRGVPKNVGLGNLWISKAGIEAP